MSNFGMNWDECCQTFLFNLRIWSYKCFKSMSTLFHRKNPESQGHPLKMSTSTSSHTVPVDLLVKCVWAYSVSWLLNANGIFEQNWLISLGQTEGSVVRCVIFYKHYCLMLILQGIFLCNLNWSYSDWQQLLLHGVITVKTRFNFRHLVLIMKSPLVKLGVILCFL